MKYLYECSICKNGIRRRKKRFFSHIKCETCNSEFELTKKSWALYSIIPFIVVGCSVLLSINFVRVNDIFIKAVFIFSCSYILYYAICILAIRLKLLQYTKR